MLARLSVLVTFFALLVIVAGCGGGGSSTDGTSASRSSESDGSKAAFIEEADAICRAYQAERKPIQVELEDLEAVAEPESPQNEAKMGEALSEVLGDAEVELESIRELEAPPGDEATIEKLLAVAEEGNEIGAEAAGALESGNTQRVGALIKEGEATNAQAKAMAESYGLKVCGQTP